MRQTTQQNIVNFNPNLFGLLLLVTRTGEACEGDGLFQPRESPLPGDGIALLLVGPVQVGQGHRAQATERSVNEKTIILAEFLNWSATNISQQAGPSSRGLAYVDFK